MVQRRAPLFVCSMAIVAALLLFSAAPPASAQISKTCGVVLGDLLSACMEFVTIPGPKVDPSAACCAQIKNVNVTCLCDHIPPALEKTISLDKAVYVARKCGKNVPAGTKCGDLTVPPLMV